MSEPVVPSWVQDAVFYQVFPDRFARRSSLSPGEAAQFKAWGSDPEEEGFQGGDLIGLRERLEYLDDLGVTALYLTPIFSSAANHRYHTFDYYQVDPLLGGNEAFRELLTAAHDRGMKVILDGVFNHTGRGFWPFHHLVEAGGDSPYKDWFTVRDWPLRPYPGGEGEHHNYESWWDLPALPKLNTDNPQVRSMILDVARHWVRFGIDGWRLDAAEQIEDHGFWREFRDAVKSENPEAYLVGEIWTPAEEWLRGDQFDAVMNYPLLVDALGFFAGESVQREFRLIEMNTVPLTVSQFADRVDTAMNRYASSVTGSQFNIMGSHDTPRLRHMLGGDRTAQQLAAVFQFTIPGAPCIYYGDEIGMSSPGIPSCREAFPWDDTGSWDSGMRSHYQSLTALRKRLRTLRAGTFATEALDGGVYAFRRTLGDESTLVVFNMDDVPRELLLPAGGPWECVFPAATDVTQTVPQKSARVFHRVDLPGEAVAGTLRRLR